MATQTLTSDRFDFDDASEAIEFYFERGWTDGLPVVPPTPEKVARFLDAAGRSPAEILCTEPTKGRVITAEKAAINAVMAGCLPGYFPVVAAAVEAMNEPRFNLHAITASTAGAAVLAVVNGPIAGELGVNSGISLFGPGHRANATIGRALRLVIGNASGSVSGVIDKATLGHPGKYTWCIAEAEEVSPWEPLHVERGFSKDDSAVTVFAGLSQIQASYHESGRPEEILGSFTDACWRRDTSSRRSCWCCAPSTWATSGPTAGPRTTSGASSSSRRGVRRRSGRGRAPCPEKPRTPSRRTAWEAVPRASH